MNAKHTSRLLALLTGLLLSWPCLMHAAGLELPLERQVFQRRADESAEVKIAGVVPPDATLVEVKADLPPGWRGKAVEWTVIARDAQIKDGKFTGSIKLQAGGWYRITVRFRKSAADPASLAESTVEQVGVGEVFVTAGQSNSANFGNPKQKAKDDRVVYFDGKSYVPAHDPIPGGCGGGGSPWSILGDLIVRSEGVPVCFRSASLTWTEVKNWMPPDTGLYKNLVKCVRPFGTNGVRAVLWHQGESDTLVNTSAATYSERLKTIIETFSRDCGYPLPWFVAQASFHPGSQAPQQKEVALGQQMSWEKKIAFEGPVTDELLGAKFRSDGVHFNQAGLDAHAERWFQSLQKQYGWKIPPAIKSHGGDGK